jgi:hypothetical protein
LASARSHSSRSPLQRVYRTKFVLVAVVSVFLGLGLIVLAHWASLNESGAWLRSWPVNEIGLGLFTTGLFGVLFQYVGKRDADEDQLQLIRQVITDDLARRPDGLLAMVSSETRDRIAENCLRLQLGDDALAQGLYADLRAQIIRSPERRYDMDVSIALTPWTGGPVSGVNAMFVATVRTDYRVRPVRPVMRFVCLSDRDEYQELLRDPSYTGVHYFPAVLGVDGGSKEAFQLVEVKLDGRSQPIERTGRSAAQEYEAHLRGDTTPDNGISAVSYTYRALARQHGHLFFIDFSRPTQNVRVNFAYGGCGIQRVNVIDSIASSRQPGLSQLPASGPTPSVGLRFDGWVLPKAEVGFVWTLDREMGPNRRRTRPDPAPGQGQPSGRMTPRSKPIPRRPNVRSH